MDAETVDSSTAVEAKGSSPLEVRKTFSMVLLEVRILLYTPILTFELTLATEEVRDLWQVRVGDVYRAWPVGSPLCGRHR